MGRCGGTLVRSFLVTVAGGRRGRGGKVFDLLRTSVVECRICFEEFVESATLVELMLR